MKAINLSKKRFPVLRKLTLKHKMIVYLGYADSKMRLWARLAIRRGDLCPAKVSNPACDSPVSFCMFGLEKSSELFSIMQIWWLWSTNVYNCLNNSTWAIAAIKTNYFRLLFCVDSPYNSVDINSGNSCDTWFKSQVDGVNLIAWICPFYWLKAPFFGTMVWHQSSKSDKLHVSVWYMQ